MISSFIVLYGTKLIASDQYKVGGVSLFDHVGAAQILAFAAAANGLFVSALSLFQSAFVQNKVEGFAFIKGTGIIALVPALLILDSFKGGAQYALGVLPNFWAIKGVMLELLPIDNSANLSYPLYLLIGAGYSLLILFATYRIFLKRVDY